MNAKYLKTIHSKEDCLCPIIVHNGNYYFCPCCHKSFNKVTDENKEELERWLISATRVLEPKPILDDNKVNIKERKTFYHLLEEKTKLILASISDDTSLESAANILEYKLSNYINITMPILLGNIFKDNSDRYRQIFINDYELRIKKH